MEHLTPERWAQVEAILEKAINLPPGERTAFLNDACADTPTLRTEVEALLAADVQDGSFLEEAAHDYRALLSEFWREQTEAELIGKRLGSYRIVQEIGRGGMGAVYLAERADGAFEKQVALKVVKRGMDTDVVLRRFLAERQILARLRHDNIARLLDGGVTDEGQPYFVIEHIDGVPITDYCDQHHLDVAARLRVFQQVCQAVQYAHRNLVVHRDLKPSNMLVTEAGQVKLLDFGIAKLLEQDEETTVMTHTGGLVMTPEYASPEQVRGEAITTATDVYALGVLLYELLTGRRPYQFTNRSAGEIERVICEVEPEAPSTAVTQTETIARHDGTTTEVTPEQVSQARGADTERLRRRLRGDLDTMVLKALRKEPERRYASAEAFLEDVRRHLAGFPVSAERDTVEYRMKKFVRRHRWGVSIAAALVVLIVGFAVAMALQQAQTAKQRDLAQAEASKLEEVKEFLVGLFEVSDPDNAEDRDITARELLERGVEAIEALEEEPEVQAEMLQVLGMVYMQLGYYETAQPLMVRSLALRQELLGEEHEEVALNLAEIAWLQYKKSNYDEAERLFRQALAMQRKLLGEQHEDVANTMNGLALVLQGKGVFEEAEQLYRDALVISRNLFGETHDTVSQSLNNLAMLLMAKGDYDGAEPLYREALAMRRELLGPDHSGIAVILNNLGLLLKTRGNLDEAEPLLLEALAMRRKLLGQEHSDVAQGLINLGGVYHARGNVDEAEKAYREALEIEVRLFGETHQQVINGRYNLAVVLHDKGSYDEAESSYRKVVALLQQLYGEEHPSVAFVMHALARLLYHKKAYQESESLHRKTLALQRKLLDANHPHIAFTLHNMGELLLDRKRPSEAALRLQEALQIRQEKYVESNKRTKTTKLFLGLSLTALGRFDEAEPLLLDSYTFFKNEHDQEKTQKTLDGLIELYTAWGRPEQAAAYQAAAYQAAASEGETR